MKTTDTDTDTSEETPSLYRQARSILRICPDIDLRNAERNMSYCRDLIDAAWWEADSHDRRKLAEGGQAPTCGCTGCDCDQPATCTDDCSNPTCDECQEYTCDDDGNVLCGKCDGVETVTESCGAGNQTRSYLRQTPPPMPQEDEDGEYALYWDTAGDDAHAVARFATAEEAEQAVAAKDWPRPGDHTNYLCGYEARQLVDGAWQPLNEEYAG